MEGCFRFQWREGGCFSDGGASFFSGGEECPIGGEGEGVLVLMGRGVQKMLDGRGALPWPPL